MANEKTVHYLGSIAGAHCVIGYCREHAQVRWTILW